MYAACVCSPRAPPSSAQPLSSRQRGMSWSPPSSGIRCKSLLPVRLLQTIHRRVACPGRRARSHWALDRSPCIRRKWLRHESRVCPRRRARSHWALDSVLDSIARCTLPDACPGLSTTRDPKIQTAQRRSRVCFDLLTGSGGGIAVQSDAQLVKLRGGNGWSIFFRSASTFWHGGDDLKII